MIRAATAKKNAELGSFGTSISSGKSGDFIGSKVISKPSHFISAPIPASMRSVWSLLSSGSLNLQPFE